MIAVDVMGELVEHHNQRKPVARGVGPVIEPACASRDQRAGKALADLLVVGRRLAEPEPALPGGNFGCRARLAEPEIEHGFRGGSLIHCKIRLQKPA
jgi:hypothetical protein